MLEITVTFLILIVLMVLPFWIFYRMAVSQETRSHLNALLLHDIIRGLVKGMLGVIRSTIVLLVTGVKKLFGP
jgi:hypothetical protein